ncbi:MAG TPA: hypothetical protein PLI98_08540, partial [Candidatus Hydrogenedentes bacterium]|nr:hypothetical protein [Candidatus Hydrogenedentota bacterium]
MRRFSRSSVLGVLAAATLLTGVPACAADGPAPRVIAARADSAPVTPEDAGAEEIVFVKRRPFSSDHYYTDIDNGTAPDRFDPANGVYVFNLRTGQERPVVTAAALPGGSGVIGKISLSFDGQKVLFDYRENPSAGFRVWEVGVDGSGLRQVSFPPADEAEKVARWGKPWHTDDIHPAYLPDGRIIFSSTRSEHTVLCGGSAHLTCPTLHRMDADGGNVEPLSASLVSEFCPVVLDDGRVMYHRWEYVDRGARVSKTVWSMNPDGSRPQELYGLADDTTTVYMYPQPLPGEDRRFVCVGTCHFPQGGCLGAVMLVDPGNGNRERGPDPDEEGYVQGDPRYAVNNITPHVFIERRTEPGWHFLAENGKYKHDREGTSGHLYSTPFPVTADRFLVSFKANPADHRQNTPNAYALWLLGADGSHRYVHGDPALSCWHPLPVRARTTPPVIQPQTNPALAAENEALCVLVNVYTGMDGVAPGEIKWLRINEAVPRYWDTARRWDPSLSSSGWKAALWPRVQWGVVPVEADGSAYFRVPANRNIFFQALDENFMEVQRERTYVNYKPGETRSCVGCHGQRNRSEHPLLEGGQPLALRRAPSAPQPQPCDLAENGGDGRAGQVIHYPTDIQPVLDAKCVSCHGEKDPAGGLNLRGDLTLYYSVSYEELGKRELAGPLISEFTSYSKGDQGNFNGAYLPPKSLGGHRSGLIGMLSDPAHPKNAKENHAALLTDRERMIFRRWADTNYQFYGSYYGRHHSDWANPEK